MGGAASLVERGDPVGAISPTGRMNHSPRSITRCIRFALVDCSRNPDSRDCRPEQREGPAFRRPGAGPSLRSGRQHAIDVALTIHYRKAANKSLARALSKAKLEIFSGEPAADVVRSRWSSHSPLNPCYTLVGLKRSVANVVNRKSMDKMMVLLSKEHEHEASSFEQSERALRPRARARALIG